MNSRERVLAALALKQPDRVPYCEHGIDAPIAKAILGHAPDRYELKISKRLGRDNIVYWGFQIPFFAEQRITSSGQGYVGEGLLKEERDISKITLPDPRREQFYDAAKDFIDHKGDFAACATINLGLHALIPSMGFENFSLSLFDRPAFVKKAFETFGEWTAAIITRINTMGFDLIWAVDDIAFKTGPLFSPQQYREILLPHLKDVARHIKLPWIYHTDGNILPIMDDWLSLGQNGMHPIEPAAMDINYLKQTYGRRVALVGNINMDALARGTPAEIVAEVRDRMQNIAPGGGYLCCSSNGIASFCKPENVLAMASAIKEYGKYPA